jgi:hypothetical protein
MQKVEGSSPFIRLRESPANVGLSPLSGLLLAGLRGLQITLADIVPAGASVKDDRLRELVAQGGWLRQRARPTPAPLPVKSNRSASALVLAEREAEH